MHEEIFRALENGATVLTASSRLARVLSRDFHSMQAGRGGRLWNRPDVLPLSAYLDRAWSEWLARYADESTPILLNAAQEQMLWEQVIRDSPSGASLLQIPETARQAAETWRVIAEYRLAVDGSFEASEDWAAFAAWAREFRRRCSANGWLERAGLSDFLRDRIAAGPVPLPGALFAAGFDEMTPKQSDFFEALGEWRHIERQYVSPIPEQRRLRNASEEIRSAAEWARGLLASDPKTQIGIIVAPDLTRSRALLQRIFGEVLDPGGERSDNGRAFHLSVGPALAEYPLVCAALLMAEFAQGKSVLPRAGLLLRSPFVGGAKRECTKRAQLDARLRKNGVWNITSSVLRDAASGCPELQRVLRRVEKVLRELPAEQRPSDWRRGIEDLLDAFGWPGDRAPSSTEFQTVAAWRELLSGLAALDLIALPMSFGQVFDWLHQRAADTRFQVEDEGAPVQVMGLLEAAGQRFDHLWIMGLDDEALPAAANPNPFLPLSLQREHRLPHSSPERELEFATKIMHRLLGSAPDIVLSYPATEGDRTLAPSPLIAGGAWLEDSAPRANDWIASLRCSAVFDEIADQAGPPLAQSDSTGGASLFKDMAACPFRAFAKHRLGARPLEDTELGLTYRDRGTTVHKALEFIWRELGSHARLIELTASEFEALIARGAEAAVLKLGPGLGRDLEKRRLQRLLSEWLAIEKSRGPFTVAEIEAERDIAIAGLQVRVRADRVDALPDGREIILDYKTGQLKSRGWEGERPDEPQLPLYCATSDRPVAGAAFAQIRTGELRFRGLTAGDATLPSLAKMSIDPAVPFERQVVEWRRVLEHVADNFRAGRAEVDPKPGACENCGLRALCRIRELQPGVPG